LDQAIELMQTAGLYREDDTAKQELVNQYQNLAFVCLKMFDPQPVAVAAQKMAEVFGNHRQDWYLAACFQSRASAQMPKGPGADAMLMQCLNSLRNALDTPGAALRREVTEEEIFKSIANHPEGQKLLKSLDRVSK